VAAPAVMLFLLLLLHLARAAAAGLGDEAAALLEFKRASVAADPRGALADWGRTAASGHSRSTTCRSLAGSTSSLCSRYRSSGALTSAGTPSMATSPRRTEPPCALVDVDLSANAFNGTLPRAFLASCSGLRSLNLSRNTLVGGGFPFPPSLQRLDMSRNMLSDAGLLNYALTSCHGTQHLNLSANQFTGGLPVLAPCSGLAVLDLSWNFLSGTLPPRFVATALETLEPCREQFLWGHL
jgi:hypothetical protein